MDYLATYLICSTDHRGENYRERRVDIKFEAQTDDTAASVARTMPRERITDELFLTKPPSLERLLEIGELSF